MDTVFDLDQNVILATGDSSLLTSLAKFVNKLLHAPVTVISAVENGHEMSQGWVGIHEGDLPQFTTFSQYVVRYEQPFIVNDPYTTPVLKNDVVEKLRIQGYLGFPIVADDGTLLGVLSVADRDARRWTGEEIMLVQELSRVAAHVMQTEARTVDELSAFEAVQGDHMILGQMMDTFDFVASWKTQLADLRSTLSYLAA